MTSDLAKAVKRCSKPETVALLVVRDRDHHRFDIMPLGWKMWASAQPRRMAFSVAQAHYSCALLERERECTLAWPGPALIDGVIKCGSLSGRDTDKAALAGWNLLPAVHVGSGLLEQAVVNLECRVEQSVPTGDHTLFIYSIAEGHVSERDERVIFTLNDESLFNHAGQYKGYRFGTFS